MEARGGAEREATAGAGTVWRGALLGGAISAAVLALMFARSPNFERADGPEAAPYAGDFVHEYAAAWIVRHGDPARLYERDYARAVQHDRAVIGFAWRTGDYSVPYYPPAYYLAVSPLAALPFVPAAWLWIGLMVACLAASVVLLARADPVWRTMLAWPLPALFLFVPLTHSLVSAQKGTLWLLLLTATYALLRRGHTLGAGATFGLLALKPPLGLAVGFVMLAGRQWHFLAAATASAVALAGAGLLLGVDATAGWVGAVLDPIAQDRAALLQKSHCWLGFSRLLLGDYGGAGVIVLTGILVAATLLACTRLVRGGLRFGEASFPLQFSGAVLATPLVSPHLYTYDLTLLLLPMGIVAGELHAGSRLVAPQRRLVLGALLGVFLLGSISTHIVARIPVQASVLAIAALLAVLVWLLERRDGGAPAPAPDAS